MTISLIFMFIMMVIVIWWLFQRVVVKPWAKEGAIEDDMHSGSTMSLPAVKVGFWVFIAVITSMFSLFGSAYYMRMQLVDWVPLTEPNILWFNTGLLLISSIAIHWTDNAVKRLRLDHAKIGLIVSGVFSFAFIFGQLMAWRQLSEAGYFLSSNPANAFFYLLTGLHAAHLLGGLWVWGRSTIRLYAGEELAVVRLNIELCATYWHYLLLLWLALFALLLST